MSHRASVEIHEDGTRHLIHGISPIKQKVLDTHEDNKRKQTELQEVQIRRIAHKRAMQRRGGWPEDKSPV